MKTYTLTEVQELLRQQREICADTSLNYYTKDRFGDHCLDYGYVRNLIRNRPSPLLPTEEVGIKEDDLQTSSCAIGNSIQQGDLMSERLYEALSALCDMWNQYCGGEWGHAFMSAGENCADVLDRYKLLKNDKGTGGEVDWDRLKFIESLLSIDPNDAVSDTTEADSSNADCNKKIPSIDWEGMQNALIDDESINLSRSWTPHDDIIKWLKTNLQDYIK